MGGALIKAVSKSVSPENILVCDQNEQKALGYEISLGVKSCSMAEVAEECDYIFLGVKPQVFGAVFEELSPMLQSRSQKPILVSMAAGVSIAAVEAFSKVSCGVIRIMPNTPVSVGEGMILYAYNALVSGADLFYFIGAMQFAGKLDELTEDKIDAASALSGCGPAFVYLFAEALADGAVECGLPRDKALFYASQTLLGAAKLLLTSDQHPGELKDAVCSPGGTTIAGVHALENDGFRAAAMDAVNAAYKRTLELKK